VKRVDLQKLSNEQLVERFVAIGEAQADASLYGDIPEFNRLYRLKVAVVDELQERPGDQRSVLLPLYDHTNLQVRLNAVTGTLALAPEEGLRVLQDMAASMKQPYAGDAGMTLSALDEGIFKPT
jgi:uncharacterized protein DUF2019